MKISNVLRHAPYLIEYENAFTIKKEQLAFLNVHGSG